MEVEEYQEKLNEYTSRNSFWTKETINQLGYSINIFTTVGISILGYLISLRKEFPKLEFFGSTEFSGILTIYLCTIFFILISIFSGFIAVLSRLFDFRITRHIANIRKKYLKYYQKNKDTINNSKNGLLHGKDLDISRYKFYKVFKKYFCGKVTFINEDNFKDKGQLNGTFEIFRIESVILGNNTWKFHKLQISTLFLSLVININGWMISMGILIVIVLFISIVMIKSKKKTNYEIRLSNFKNIISCFLNLWRIQSFSKSRVL